MMSVVHPVIVGTPEPLGTASWLWSDENHTREFAQALAQQIELRDAYIELQGDLGAGKTTFVRHLLKALGVEGRIKSPTYAVVEPHEARPSPLPFASSGAPISLEMMNIWHFDFYRFNDPQEFEEAGFRDLFASPGLKIAEWPEQARGMLPVSDLKLAITVNEQEGRFVICETHTRKGLTILQGLLNFSPALANSQAAHLVAHHAHPET
jgi:tRNA threonylcarbamoyladenosine biosynthesis protein TsaE